MEPTEAGNDTQAGGPDELRPAPPLPRGVWGRVPAITYVLPFLVYMLVGMVEPKPPKAPEPKPPQPGAAQSPADAADAQEELDEKIRAAREHYGEDVELNEHGEPVPPLRLYPAFYTTKIGLTLLAMLLVLPGYLVWRPFRVNWIALAVGAVGIVVWVGLCKLDLEEKLLVPIGLGKFVDMGIRPGFNPLEQIKDNPNWAYGFLAIRLLGLVIIVPIIEEFFIRGFLIRYIMDVDWFKIPFGKLDRLGMITATVVPMLMHPAEVFAALAWFSMITWLMIRTRNIWDCVAAHAVTNALLGAYVLTTGDWQFM
ncbi:MAG: CAAX prenyl protease-related protein [Planctomycetota bacterium]|nr:MAG: CAAX prenyl protease-related protein [Planctomycetota bacterium]